MVFLRVSVITRPFPISFFQNVHDFRKVLLCLLEDRQHTVAMHHLRAGGHRIGDKLRLKLLESGVIHTVTLKQTECRKRNKKIAAAVYLYQADNDGEWGEIRFDFENGTAEIVKMADWDTVKSNVFAKAAIRFVQSLPETRLLKSTVVPFEMERLDLI